MLCQDLLGVAGELLPATWKKLVQVFVVQGTADLTFSTSQDVANTVKSNKNNAGERENSNVSEKLLVR